MDKSELMVRFGNLQDAHAKPTIGNYRLMVNFYSHQHTRLSSGVYAKPTIATIDISN
jgi:hypothetical protein